jgi:serine/threonine protein kinase
MAGDFEYHKRLGSGHFGEVWLVTDKGLNATRALKIIPKDKLVNKANFFVEAQTLKAAEHPNIVRVEETGLFENGSVYVAMEYLRRRSVADEAKGAPLSMSRAKQLMVDLLRGLAHAHGKGIIHRDIKPANLLVGPALEGKLSDFGLALDLGSPDALAVKDYAYIMHLAPEIDKPERYSAASDVYAAGVTLYRLINGDRSLAGLPLAEVRKRTKIGTYPDRTDYKEYVPKKLRDVVDRALEVSPAKRFASADAMRRTLEQVPLKVDWVERDIPDGTRWRGRGSGYRYEVLRKKTSLGWAVVARRAKIEGDFRLVSGMSQASLSEDAARKLSRRLLQRLTVGKTP